jgi:hypothetical protein
MLLSVAVSVEGRQKTSLVFTYTLTPEESTSRPDPEQLINEIVVATPTDIPLMFIDLIAAMKTLTLEELKDIETNIRQSEEKQSVFLDALTFTGTEQAVALIVELTHPDYPLSDTQKTSLALSLTILIQDDDSCKLLTDVLRLAKNRETCRISTLTLGAVLNKLIEYKPSQCKGEIDLALQYLDSKIKRHVKELPSDYNPLENADHEKYKDNWEQAVYAIKALGNAKISQSIGRLKDCAKQKNLLVEGQTAAIVGLKGISSKKPSEVRSFVLDLYQNHDFEVEIRIAAFSTFMETMQYSCSSSCHKELHKVLEQTVKEPENSEVLSYVCSYLQTLNSTVDPAFKKLHHSILHYPKWTDALNTCSQVSSSVFSSKYAHWYKSLAQMVKPDLKDSTGMSLSVDYVSTKASRIPRLVTAKWNAWLLGHNVNVMETGIRTTGIEKLICTMAFGSEGYLRLGSATQEAYDYFCGRHQEETSLSVSLKAMGKEIYWETYHPDVQASDADSVRDSLIDYFARVKSLPSDMLSYFKYLATGEHPILNSKMNVNKTAGFLNIRTVIPTIIGTPINLLVSAAGHLQFDFAGSIEHFNAYPIRATFGGKTEEKINARLDVHPELHMTAKVQLLIDDYDYKPKLIFSANSSANFHQVVSAEISKDKVDVTVHEMPIDEALLFDIRYSQFAEIDGKQHQLDTKPQQGSSHIKAYDFIGLDVFMNVSYVNGTGSPTTSVLPMLGPASMTVSLKRPNPNLSKVVFSLERNSLKHQPFHVNAKLVAVGVNRSTDASLDWERTNETFVMKGSLTSAVANSSANIIIDYTSDLKVESYFDFNSSLATFTAGMGLNSTHINANSSLFIGMNPMYKANILTAHKELTSGILSCTVFIKDQTTPHILKLKAHLRNQTMTVRGELIINGEEQQCHVRGGISAGKWFVNASYFVSGCGQSLPVHKGVIRASANLDNIRNIKFSSFVYLSPVFFYDSDCSLDTKGTADFTNWAVTSFTRAECTDKDKSWMTVTGWSGKTMVVVLPELSIHETFHEVWHKDRSGELKLISRSVHKTKLQRLRVIAAGIVTRSDFSAVFLITHMDQVHHVNMKGTFDNSWYKNVSATAVFLADGQTLPHKGHIAWNVGKWFVDGTGSLKLPQNEHPYQGHVMCSYGNTSINTSAFYQDADAERPYRMLVNGSFGNFWVNGSGSFQMPHNLKPFQTSLKGEVGKWFINISSTIDLDVNSSIWNDTHYLDSNMSLAGRAIKISANSSLIGLRAVKTFLQIDDHGSHSILDITDQQTKAPKSVDSTNCTILKKFLKVQFDDKTCRSAKKHRICSYGCEEVYNTDKVKIDVFHCVHDDEEFDLDAAFHQNVLVSPFVGCQKIR